MVRYAQPAQVAKVAAGARDVGLVADAQMLALCVGKLSRHADRNALRGRRAANAQFSMQAPRFPTMVKP